MQPILVYRGKSRGSNCSGDTKYEVCGGSSKCSGNGMGNVRDSRRGRMMNILLLLLLLAIHCHCLFEDEVRAENYHGPVHYSDGDDDVTGKSIEALLDQGLAAVAHAFVVEAMREGNHSDSMQINLARALVQLGRAGEGEEILLEVASKPQSDQYMDAHLLLGRLYLLGQESSNKDTNDRAEKHFKTVIDQDPSHPSALAALGKIYMVRDEDYTAANLYLARAVQSSPGDEKILFDHGISLLYLGQMQQARENFEQAARLNPTIDRNVIGKIYLHFKQTEWAALEFETAFQVSLELRRAPDLEALILLAESYDQLANSSEAQDVLRYVIKESPRPNPLAHAGLGLMLLGTSSRNYGAMKACGLNREEAMQHLRLALEIAPRLAVLEQAREALAFCEQEAEEAEMWAQVLAQEGGLPQAGTPQGKADSRKDMKIEEVEYDEEDEEESRLSRSNDREGVALPILILHHLKADILNGIRRALRISGLCAPSKVIHFLPPVAFLCAKLLPAKRPRYIQKQWKQAKDHYSAQHEVLDRKEAMLARWRSRQDISGILRTNITTHDQLMRYVLGNTPVVIKNFQIDWGDNAKDGTEAKNAPMQAAFSTEALSTTFGDSLVRVSVSESGRFDGPEDGALWGLAAGTEVLVRPPTTSMKFRHFLSLVSQNASSIESSPLSFNESFYMEYLSLQQYLGPAFERLIPLPQAVRDAEELKMLVSNLWIAGSPTTSPLHYDDYENFLCQIRGHKELILFPPVQLPYLYYQGRPKGFMTYEFPGSFLRDPLTVDKRGHIFGSGVNVDYPDESRHPFYKKHATPIRVVLHPGDVLYLPAFWHHEVQSLPDEEGLNVAVNFWFANLTAPIDDEKMLGLR